MKFKQLVLARFPEARPMVVTRWPDGSPRHVTIVAGDRRLELPSRDGSAWLDDNIPRGHAAAWQAAHYWCMHHPAIRTQADLLGDDPHAGDQ